MSKDPTEGSNQRTSPAMRKASLLLSGLVLTPDSALDSFRKRRAADPDLDESHLRRARDLLDAVASAITTCEPAEWRRIEQAWSAMQEGGSAKPTVADAPASPAPPPPSRFDPAPSPAPPAPVGSPLPAGSAPPPMGARRESSPWAGPQTRSPIQAPQSTAATPPSVAAPPPIAGPPPIAAPPIAAPPIAAPPPSQPHHVPSAAPSQPAPQPPHSAPAIPLGVDVEALNRIKLDGDDAGTLPADTVFARARALPFQGEVAAPPSALSDGELDDESADPLGLTTTGYHNPLVGSSLPFDRDDEQPLAAHDYAPTARLSPVTDPRTDDAAQIDHGPQGSGSSQPPAPPARGSDAARTMLSPHQHGPPPSMPPHLLHMTLEQYAALCAECAATPQWTQAIHARYGIRSHEERLALDSHWHRQLQSDEHLTNTYRWHYARYEEWAKSRGG